ncbi:DUF1566 domain-containing protein [Pseudomonas sp. GD04087]|uniref:hypothetical protein n=1 Tax=unclassified Pseudomonas TaxID=196821 RepID=UPI00244C6376|nr:MULTISPECIES: hypothetical protein [unclassified Pseudomonas]MDH0293375.1 DUF1566 domain-containing protein [Pseudomonas sp. GD04087]MDH1053030.1 DUF1566 domain-containing protein [Pseudomonas sp. GD03903]MDH2003592.1 DUF1566 domain-containing protein [Pseudomonas sp. GD03691]
MTEIITSVSAAELPAIGAALAGGIFAGRYYINEQARALVVLSPEQEFEGAWGEYGQDLAGTHWVDGEANTRAMAEAGSEIAKKALELGAFIPSCLEGQLVMAAKHAGLITDLREDRLYWLSTQCSADLAYYVDFEGGWQYHDVKGVERLVRPVRSLTILQ